MAALEEDDEWDDELYRIELIDPVEGGEDGIDNINAKKLGSRTRYLKALAEAAATLLAGATSAATALTAMLRNADGDTAVRWLTATRLVATGASLAGSEALTAAVGATGKLSVTFNASELLYLGEISGQGLLRFPGYGQVTAAGNLTFSGVNGVYIYGYGAGLSLQALGGGPLECVVGGASRIALSTADTTIVCGTTNRLTVQDSSGNSRFAVVAATTVATSATTAALLYTLPVTSTLKSWRCTLASKVANGARWSSQTFKLTATLNSAAVEFAVSGADCEEDPDHLMQDLDIEVVDNGSSGLNISVIPPTSSVLSHRLTILELS